MSRRPTCASLILAFVAATGVASIRRIVAFMAFMAYPPLATPATTTRNVVWRLTRAGRLQRIGFGRYQAVEQ